MPCDGISGGVRCRPICVRTKYVLAYPWGAPRLHAAALSSLPACGLVSPADPAISLPLSTPTAACPRPSALTLNASARRTIPPLPIRLRRCPPGTPRSWHRRQAATLSLPPGFVLPAVALAPPRFHPYGLPCAYYVIADVASVSARRGGNALPMRFTSWL